MATIRRVIYSDSPLWIELLARVNTLSDVLKNSAGTINRTERALMGGWDESGTKWIEGLRDKVQHVDEKVDVANLKADSFVGLARWAVGVLTAIFVGLMTELANGYFGWWGAAHTAALTSKVLTGGH